MTLRSTRDASRGRILSATAILALLLLAQAADFASAGSKASAFTDDDDDEAYDPDDVEEEVKHTFKPREQPKPQKSPGRVKAALEAEDSENWDPDEFEGFEKPAAPPPKREKKAPGSGARGLQAQPPRELKDLIVEIIFMVLLAVYFVLYFIGRSQNTTVAERFLAAVGDTLEDQFALVGAYGELRWERDGPSCFKLYCSGRLNCEKLNMTLDLKPRQETISRVYDLFQPISPDQVKLEIALGDGAETGGPMEAFSFAVMPKGDEKDIREANKDLEDSARRFKSALHDSLVALGSDEEVVREFLPPAVVSVLNEHRHFIKLVYFSDRMQMGPVGARYQGKGLKFIFNLQPTFGQPKTGVELAQAWDMLMVVALRYIDKVTTYRLSGAAKERIKKMQQTLAELEFKRGAKQREQQAQQRKQEKLRAEQASMTPEAREKFEEKQRLKQRKNIKSVIKTK